VTKSELYSFFRELARPFAPNQPAAAATPETMQQLFEVAAKYGYWLASPAENAAIGLNIECRPASAFGSNHAPEHASLIVIANSQLKIDPVCVRSRVTPDSNGFTPAKNKSRLTSKGSVLTREFPHLTRRAKLASSLKLPAKSSNPENHVIWLIVLRNRVSARAKRIEPLPALTGSNG